MSVLSTFLFARPSFLEGLARVFDVGGTLQEYNYSPTGEIADYFAMMADFRCVGQDMQFAIDAAKAGKVDSVVEKTQI